MSMDDQNEFGKGLAELHRKIREEFKAAGEFKLIENPKPYDPVSQFYGGQPSSLSPPDSPTAFEEPQFPRPLYPDKDLTPPEFWNLPVCSDAVAYVNADGIPFTPGSDDDLCTDDHPIVTKYLGRLVDLNVIGKIAKKDVEQMGKVLSFLVKRGYLKARLWGPAALPIWVNDDAARIARTTGLIQESTDYHLVRTDDCGCEDFGYPPIPVNPIAKVAPRAIEKNGSLVIPYQASAPSVKQAALMTYVHVESGITDDHLNGLMGFRAFISEGDRPSRWPKSVRGLW